MNATVCAERRQDGVTAEKFDTKLKRGNNVMTLYWWLVLPEGVGSSAVFSSFVLLFECGPF